MALWKSCPPSLQLPKNMTVDGMLSPTWLNVKFYYACRKDLWSCGWVVFKQSALLTVIWQAKYQWVFLKFSSNLSPKTRNIRILFTLALIDWALQMIFYTFKIHPLISLTLFSNLDVKIDSFQTCRDVKEITIQFLVCADVPVPFQISWTKSCSKFFNQLQQGASEHFPIV